MYQKSIIRLLFAWTMICISVIAISQPPRGPLAISPRVLPDKKVTFNYIAPHAKDVKLSGQFLSAPVAMKKEASGMWSVTVGPVRPDMYPYSFVVDGVTVMDPANEEFFPNEKFKGSLLDVPGYTPLVHAMQDVPHGAVNYEYYPSIEGTTGTVVVYTPPGYDKNATTKYPVYYLISGTTDTEETFFKVGRTNFILDNLIAEGKSKPMIIVMPYGNMEARIAEQKTATKPADPVRDSPDAITRMRRFEQDLTKQVIPFIDKNYRTIPNRENRAIGGFSRGGGQTLRTAFWNFDTFAWICAYSANLPTSEMEGTYSSIFSNSESTNKQLKLLWVGVGTEDFLYNDVSAFLIKLKEKKINYKSMITGGGHTWMNVKTYLAETAQLLFK